MLALWLSASLCAADTNQLVRLLSDVGAAQAHRCKVRDDRGISMDSLKVFQTGAGEYMGLYHGWQDGVFSVHLARSADLLNWKHVTRLDEHASQPTIRRGDDGSYLLAYEKDAPNSCWIRLRFYKDIRKLRAGAFQKEHDIERTLAPTAEGTPSFESVRLGDGGLEHSEIKLRFHYFKDAYVDQAARGTLTDFTSWTAQPSDKVNAELIGRGVHGNIGDRDRFEWNARVFYLQEAQLKRNDWSSWRVFLCDANGMPIEQLPIKTRAGSVSFCNPNVTWITDKNAQKKLVVTLFLPSEGNAVDEAGELIYVIDPTAGTDRVPNKL